MGCDNYECSCVGGEYSEDAFDPDVFARRYCDLLHEVEQLRERRAASSNMYESLRERMHDAIATVVITRKHVRDGNFEAAIESLGRVQKSLAGS